MQFFIALLQEALVAACKAEAELKQRALESALRDQGTSLPQLTLEDIVQPATAAEAEQLPAPAAGSVQLQRAVHGGTPKSPEPQLGDHLHGPGGLVRQAAASANKAGVMAAAAGRYADAQVRHGS